MIINVEAMYEMIRELSSCPMKYAPWESLAYMEKVKTASLLAANIEALRDAGIPILWTCLDSAIINTLNN